MLARVVGKKDKPKASLVTLTAPLSHSPFASLAGADGAVAAAADSAETASAKPSSANPKHARSRGRLVLRRETKHRAGKAVMVVTGFDALPDFDRTALEALTRELKQTFGCGGTIESAEGGSQLILQTRQAAKLAEALRNAGFRVDGVTT